MTSQHAEAVIDLAAIRDNVSAIRGYAGGRDLMAVVKADGYGHGIVAAARAARAGGATWLGVAFLREALALRSAGDRGPVLAWLSSPAEQYDEALAADVTVAASTPAQLRAIASAAARRRRRAEVHLKLDSGLARGGAYGEVWGHLVDEAVEQQGSGRVQVTGIFSHLACADEVGHPANAAQLATFEAGLGHAVERGLEPQHVHLANSAGTLAHPNTWFTMVRPGIAIYGLSPFADDTSPVPLTPAMTLRTEIALVKRVPAGQGVSYGHTYTTAQEATLALVPVGYGDGIPRHASGVGPVSIAGARYTVSGRVSMDQFVVDVDDADVRPGEEVVVFGDPSSGAPSAHEWAQAIDTISYEIVTRVMPRVPRRYVGGADR